MSHMENPLATPDQLFQRRSLGSLPIDLQDIIFFATQCLTQAAGLLLQLPQSVTAQANVLLARYWLVEPMMSHEFSDVSAAILYLTAKLSPHPRSPRDISNVYAYLTSPSSSLFHHPSAAPPPPIPNPQDSSSSTHYLSESTYQAFHTRLLALEARVLYALGFDTHVALPYSLAVTYLQALDFLLLRAGGGGDNTNTTEKGKTKAENPQKASKNALAHLTLTYLTTALLSPQHLYLTSPPSSLATAAIYNAARDLGAKMPACEWWEVFDVDREELGFLVVGMRSVEGWGRRMRGDMEGMMMRGGGGRGRGVLRRGDVEGELGRRGIRVVSAVPEGEGGGGGGGGEGGDLEEEMARRMDEKMAGLEG
ncbi:cyclin-like protein [Chaetomium sp. MPI-SDFR-AT-0129]|nr:cyclin-like protein [Chaetomium sp. MPI-SDFR-AT-0129]